MKLSQLTLPSPSVSWHPAVLIGKAAGAESTRPMLEQVPWPASKHSING